MEALYGIYEYNLHYGIFLFKDLAPMFTLYENGNKKIILLIFVCFMFFSFKILYIPIDP